MTVDISLGQLLSTLITGIVAYYVKGNKDELGNIRADLKEERDARGNIENRLSAVEARCAERHEYDRAS